MGRDLETAPLTRRMMGSKNEILYLSVLRKERTMYLKKITDIKGGRNPWA